ncbi:glycosyltransferase [Bradyrhizobium sp. BR 10289]|uniref:glycosyltransferase n=1 Tax=Bradyrhizobium sp. BR 10289 TaxID=2749993 RepID=UPI001E39BE9F|nr:glycosyltransferase [Bradyrhizobium sp. BR 10289]
MGLKSFVKLGHRVELFTYDFSKLDVPDWIVRRDASEIWPSDRVLTYKKDIGAGSFALHSNLFRYALLYKMGGWWTDLDVILLRDTIPQTDFFFTMETADPTRATFSVIKFPAGHPAMSEARDQCISAGERPFYGETGADLFSRVVQKYELTDFAHPMQSAYPISALDVSRLFDPGEREPLQQQCANSCFLHLFNETWRRAGIPNELGPPVGSLVERLLLDHGLPIREPRMDLADLKRWTAYLNLHEEYQAGLRAYRLAHEALQQKVLELEASAESRALDAQSVKVSPLRRVLRLIARTEGR